ncbi:MAG TPA: right-handed parallel beta-helix repeat-containing protein [Chloroflexota bacterium]|nr:right-handed parallel beta-helix repeat-containing protein [Chloroflexota bacterium]
MSDAIQVTLTPTTIETRPTTPVEVIVTIQNTGSTVERYVIDLKGLPREWYTLPEGTTGLFPNDREDVRIIILSQQEAGMEAGAHAFTVTVSGRANLEDTSEANGTLRVAAAPSLEVQLRPTRATGRKARYGVLLRNNGNAPIDVDLEAHDSEEGCDFEVKPLMIQVRPGQRVTVNIAARPLHPRLTGMPHPFDFRVAVKPSLGPPTQIQGVFIYTPRFRSLRLLYRLVTLAVLVVAAAIAAPIALSHLREAARELLVQPNASIGAVRLGATNPDAVMAALGNNATMTNHDTLITQSQKTGTLQARVHAGQVVSIATTSPAFKTAGGIHVGSSIAALRKAFGPSIKTVGQSAVTLALLSKAHSGAEGAKAAVTPGGATLALMGKNTADGKPAVTYFDLNKSGTQVEAIRTGYAPWINPDHGGPTQVTAITTTETWGLAGGPYIVHGDTRIAKGVALTIQPGVHVYFTGPEAGLQVDGGALTAVGAADAPIVFTSINDQQHGALDTLQRPAPQPGDWMDVGVTGAGGALHLGHVQVYYGGSSAKTSNAELYIAGGGKADVAIQDSDIAAAKGYGLNAAGAPPGTAISGDTFAADPYPLLIGGGISIDNSNVFTSTDDPPNTHNAVFVTPSATIATSGETVNWSLAGVPFILQAMDLVDAQGTLQLGPDVILKGFDLQSRLSVLDARLIVTGTPGHEVVMTSYHDDAHGGDTNADGKATSPQPGDWRGLILKGATKATIQGLRILYGGATMHPALGIQDHASAEINNAEVAFSANDGIYNRSDQPVAITHSSIHDNADIGIRLDSAAQPMTTLTANRLTNNGTATQGTTAQGGPTPITAITTTETLALAGSPYLISGDVHIPTGITVTIQPGVHIFFSGANSGLQVAGGALSAVGTAAAPIVLTSINDPQFGTVDTRKHPAPQPGDWGSVGVTSAGGSLQLDFTQIYYGGASTRTGNAEIYIAGGGKPDVSIQDSVIAGAKGYGLNAGAAPPNTSIQRDIFVANTIPLLIGGGISIDNSNVFSAKGVPSNLHNAVFVTPSATIATNGATVDWSLAGVPFILQAMDLVDAQGTLQLGPGVILKGFDLQSRLSVLDASLIVAGTPGHEVVMTSYHDDAHGGDTNADGNGSLPQPGDWRGLILKGTTKAAIQHLRILYGGATNHPALGIQDHASAEISNAEVAFSATDGIYNTSDQPVAINGSAIHDNADFGIDLGPTAPEMTTLSANTEAQNGKGDLGNSHALPPTPVAGATATPPPPTPAMGDMIQAASATPITIPAAITPTATIAMSDMTTPAATDSPTVAANTDTPAPTDTPTPAVPDSPTAPAATVIVIPTDTPTPDPTAADAPTQAAPDTATGTATDTPTATETPVPPAVGGSVATGSPTAASGGRL